MSSASQSATDHEPTGDMVKEGRKMSTYMNTDTMTTRPHTRSVAGLEFVVQDLPTVSVVMPAMNEAKNLPYVLPRIPRWVDEVILVDGNSIDDTVQVACQLWPRIRIVHQKGKGKGDALRAGFQAARGEIIVMLDADGSTDPAEIPLFVAHLRAGADFAKGSRFVQGGDTTDMPLYRKLGNGVFALLVRLFFGGRYSDLCYGYNAFWARLLPYLNLDGDGFEIETMMNIRALYGGFRIAEVPSIEAERIHGVSNLKTIPDGWRVLKTILKERFARNWKRPSQRRVPATAQHAIGGAD
jgi:glycosyltransferase involved in cell wall biosynthesis